MNDKYAYSAKTNSFYPAALRPLYEESGTWPTDSVDISEDIWRSLLEGQSQGRVLSQDENGYPILIEPPAPTLAEMSKIAELKKIN